MESNCPSNRPSETSGRSDLGTETLKFVRNSTCGGFGVCGILGIPHLSVGDVCRKGFPAQSFGIGAKMAASTTSAYRTVLLPPTITDDRIAGQCYRAIAAQLALSSEGLFLDCSQVTLICDEALKLFWELQQQAELETKRFSLIHVTTSMHRQLVKLSNAYPLRYDPSSLVKADVPPPVKKRQPINWMRVTVSAIAGIGLVLLVNYIVLNMESRMLSLPSTKPELVKSFEDGGSFVKVAGTVHSRLNVGDNDMAEPTWVLVYCEESRSPTFARVAGDGTFECFAPVSPAPASSTDSLELHCMLMSMRNEVPSVVAVEQANCKLNQLCRIEFRNVR